MPRVGAAAGASGVTTINPPYTQTSTALPSFAPSNVVM